MRFSSIALIAALLAGCLAFAAPVLAQDVTFPTVTLSTTDLDPPPTGVASARGTASFTLTPSTRQLTWNISVNGLTSDMTGVHIHGPSATGITGGTTITLTSAGARDALKGSMTSPEQQATEIQAGLYYVDVHTTANPNGELRGQIALR